MLPVWLFLGQNCNYWLFFNSFGFLFLKKGSFWPIGFLCRFGRFKDGFGRFLGTGRFLDTAYGHRMTNFYWKLCTRIYNFFVLLFHAFGFADSGYSSARPTVSRSLLMEWALFFFCIKYVCIALKSAFGCSKGVLCIYLVFGFMVLFGVLRVDLAFYPYNYLATLVSCEISLCWLLYTVAVMLVLEAACATCVAWLSYGML